MKYGFSNEPNCKRVASLYKEVLFNDIRGPSLPKEAQLPPVQPNIVNPFFVVNPTKETCVK